MKISQLQRFSCTNIKLALLNEMIAELNLNVFFICFYILYLCLYNRQRNSQWGMSSINCIKSIYAILTITELHAANVHKRKSNWQINYCIAVGPLYG